MLLVVVTTVPSNRDRNGLISVDNTAFPFLPFVLIADPSERNKAHCSVAQYLQWFLSDKSVPGGTHTGSTMNAAIANFSSLWTELSSLPIFYQNCAGRIAVGLSFGFFWFSQ